MYVERYMVTSTIDKKSGVKLNSKTYYCVIGFAWYESWGKKINGLIYVESTYISFFVVKISINERTR